ncbi:epoxide hydrolase family protein [Stackebrandtia nassauensis]|uniref:Microsomal epoxide hydrolase n=1 Tax=Stackebrandtia nassauensis (strain DSM 44728 / CIP 108903 / NRRL B-16338 / NBRC 102104 / LLR-40K-21) TaxID=446470 RepID=D3Q9S0_STANL|nr:epoxide hydrolase family protein [Stackebrandtia nassauensis]ADD44616.1 Microsomal epoxide hydrolase [Stackebrandtia nassauensis DSM 44728]
MSVHPFRIDIPQSEIDDLASRLDRTRWPEANPSGIGWDRGVPPEYLKGLVDHWRKEYDWRAAESRLNAFPQFRTEIDGQTIHFLHIRSAEADATPLLLTHGWPSSFVEFTGIVGPLTDPRAHGADPADAFHLVIPSLPGFGFSNPMSRPGWGNLFQVASAWKQLMERLGYDRYAAHGSDAGAGVTTMLSMLDAEHLIAGHVAGPAPFPFGPPIDTAGLSGGDLDRAERFNEFQQDGTGYLRIQATRPQTLGYSLNDSPVGQLAWIAEKFAEWTDPATELPDEAVDREQLLTLVSLYWFTQSGASSAHFTYDGMRGYAQMAQHSDTDAPPPSGAPTGVAVFAADHSIRSIVDPAGSMASWTEYPHGGHFPAMEVPGLLTEELRNFFRKW